MFSSLPRTEDKAFGGTICAGASGYGQHASDRNGNDTNSAGRRAGHDLSPASPGVALRRIDVTDARSFAVSGRVVVACVRKSNLAAHRSVERYPQPRTRKQQAARTGLLHEIGIADIGRANGPPELQENFFH